MIIRADPWYRAMTEEEVRDFLSKPLLMRIGMVDRDNYPVVHPVWFLYKDGKFLLVSDRESKKVRMLRRNDRVYFVIDELKPRGVRGKGRARIAYELDASEVMREEILRYMGSLDNAVAKRLMDSVNEMVVIEVKPNFLATWIA